MHLQLNIFSDVESCFSKYDRTAMFIIVCLTYSDLIIASFKMDSATSVNFRTLSLSLSLVSEEIKIEFY